MGQLAETLLAGLDPRFTVDGALPGARVIGQSEEGQRIHGYKIGKGARGISLVAGAHADEPVGPETLRLLVRYAERLGPLLDDFTFRVVPHVNPDGAARNQGWIDAWPDPEAYRSGVVREPPGRDVEFGYPDLRPENIAVSAFLTEGAPYALHMSLHGMAVAEGGMLLVEKHWVDRTQELRAAYGELLDQRVPGRHDHDRHGDKGFQYLGAGFWTTPEGSAMRAYFAERGDDEMAARFRDSSMEFVRSLGGDPLCLVTEIPLFVVANPDPQPGHPAAFLALKKRWGERGALDGTRSVPPATAIALQLDALALGIAAID